MVATIRLAAVMSFLVLFTPSTSYASSILVGESASWTYDGTAEGCSTCQATVLLELLSGTSLRIAFENSSTDWLAGVNLLTGIGFTASELGDVTLSDQAIEGGKVWKLSSGIGAGTWDLALASKNGINNGLDNQFNGSDSGWVILTWTSTVLGLTMDGSVAKFQGVATDGGAVHAIGTAVGSTVENQPVSGPESQGSGVPEPATLLLFAAGAAASLTRLQARTRGAVR